MNKKQITLAVLAALTLSACGGSSDDETSIEEPTEPTFSLTASDDSGESLNGESVSIDVAANDSYDGDGELTISVISSDDAAGSVNTDGTSLTYTPAEGFLGTTDITYEITDGDLTAEAVVSITSAETLSIAGTVTDSPIADAVVTVSIGGETFEAKADAEGNYQLELKISSQPGDSAIRINASGAEENEQAYVTLSSLLAGYEEIRTAAGDDRSLNREESNAVQVTQVSTAKDILVQELAGTDSIAADALSDLSARVDGQELLQTAGVIKLLVDSPDEYPLPEGYTTIQELLADDAAYQNIVAMASEAAEGETSDLDQAIAATLADDTVVESIPFDELTGHYLVYIRGNETIGTVASGSWMITEDGSFIESSDSIGSLPRVTERQVEQSNGETIITSESTAFSNSIPSQYSDGLYDDLDPELLNILQAWKSEQQSSIQLNYLTEFTDFKGLSRDESSVIVGYENTEYLKSWEFEYQGETYVVPRVISYKDENATMVLQEVGSFQGGEGTFDIASEDTWVIPVLGLSKYATDAQQRGSYGYGDIVEFQGTDSDSGTFTSRFTQASGDWTLNDAGTELTLSYTVAGHDITSHFVMQAQSEAGFLTVLNTLSVEESGVENSPIQETVGTVTSLRRVAPMGSVSHELVAPDMAVARFLSPENTSWNDGVPPLEKLNNSYWYFSEDGSVDSVRKYCNGEAMEYNQVCDKSNFELKVVDGETFFWSVASENSIGLGFNGFEDFGYFPVYTFLSQDEESSAVMVMELWNRYYQAGCTIDSCPLDLYPRLKPWVPITDEYPVSRAEQTEAAVANSPERFDSPSLMSVEDTL